MLIFNFILISAVNGSLFCLQRPHILVLSKFVIFSLSGTALRVEISYLYNIFVG